MLAATELGEIWGIVRRIGEQLRAYGLKTILDAAKMDPAVAWRGATALESRCRKNGARTPRLCLYGV